jgi:NhaP-type Na+/H+ or K+/H+ antiporter
MLPVAVALARGPIGWAGVAFIGWFGPRGLASVVFALVALEELDEKVAGQAVAVIVVTVLLSVIAHGASAEPLARRFGPRLASDAPEEETPDLPERRLIRRTG